MEYLGQNDKWLLVFDNLKVGENKKIQDFNDTPRSRATRYLSKKV